MTDVDELLALMRHNPRGVRFVDLCRVCDYYFGKARQSGTSHQIYKTPWAGDPRVNIQSAKGKAKSYQVRQILMAIARLESRDDKN